MSSWRTEFGFLSRYLGSGLVNTAIGVSTIVALTWSGLNPFLANAAGYFVGLTSGYLLSRRYTFQSKGAVGSESLRYAAAFAAAYAANVGALHVCLAFAPDQPIAGQLIGAGTYSAAMYVISRFYVFTPRAGDTLVD